MLKSFRPLTHFASHWLKTCFRRNLQYIRPWIPHNLFRFPIEFLQVLSLEKHFTPWHLFIFKFVFFQDVFYTELHICKRFIYLKWNIRHVSLSVCHEISLTYPKWHILVVNFRQNRSCFCSFDWELSSDAIFVEIRYCWLELWTHINSDNNENAIENSCFDFVGPNFLNQIAITSIQKVQFGVEYAFGKIQVSF